VREEVEENLLLRLGGMESGDVNRVLDSYVHLIDLMKPEMVPFPGEAEVVAGRHLIRHAADVPVLLSAIASRPDWFITHNTKHFTPAVARRTGLRIATPVEFFVLSQIAFPIHAAGRTRPPDGRRTFLLCRKVGHFYFAPTLDTASVAPESAKE